MCLRMYKCCIENGWIVPYGDCPVVMMIRMTDSAARVDAECLGSVDNLWIAIVTVKTFRCTKSFNSHCRRVKTALIAHESRLYLIV
jgi:hypothetical protein